MQNQDTLKAEFDRLGPWITRYHIGDEAYGGSFDAVNDGRVTVEFAQAFPQAQTILELGSLEGGHSIALSRLPAVTRVVALESREPNLARARFAQQCLNNTKVEFIQANLEVVDLAQWGRFDAIFCSGLLYHLPEPWKLLNTFPKVSDNVYISTHYAVATDEIVERSGYQGKVYGEFGIEDPLSGMSDHSFWPTLPELERMLHDAGYSSVTRISDTPDHPHGGLISLKITK